MLNSQFCHLNKDSKNSNYLKIDMRTKNEKNNIFTSPIPSTILTATSKYTLCLAAKGVIIVRRDVVRIPIPNTHLPPRYVANHPPGSCVNM